RRPVRRATARQEWGFRLCGRPVVPDVSGALFLPDHSTLVVADIHFEKGSAFAARGIHLPPYDTRANLAALEHLCARYAPATVVALGDSFHDREAVTRSSPDDASRLARLTRARRWIWITGNHDPEPPECMGGEIMDEMSLAPFVLRHIPSPVPAAGEIAGHLHPVASVIMRGRKLRRRCFASDGVRLVMPAFGAFTGGLCVRSQAFAPVFETAFSAWMIGRERIYPVSSRRLCRDS